MFLINVAAYLVIGEILWSVLGNYNETPNGAIAHYETGRFFYVIIMLALLAAGIAEAVVRAKREKK